MYLCGIQKLTLLDYPGKVACTVFTHGCDLRCPFCHNASLVVPGRETVGMEESDLFAFLEKRRGILDGVAVTGGEPLLHPQLPELLSRIRDMGYSVKLDTNGTFPERLREIVSDGLADMIAMDIKGSPEKYPRICGTPGMDISPVMESAEFLMSCGTDYEFRTTVVKGLHETGDFKLIGEWIRGAKAYFLQNYVDSGDIVSPEGLSSFEKDELETMADTVRPYVPSVKIRGI